MSFATAPLVLPGSIAQDRPLKHCNGCDNDRDPGGGVDLGPGRWCCAGCWTIKTNPGKTGHFKHGR